VRQRPLLSGIGPMVAVRCLASSNSDRRRGGDRTPDRVLL